MVPQAGIADFFFFFPHYRSINMKGKAHLPLQIQIRRERLFRHVTSKHWAVEDGPARWKGLMCPGKLGKCLSSHPTVCQEQCLALPGMESGLPQAQGAAGHTAPHNREAALPLTAGTKLNHHPEHQARAWGGETFTPIMYTHLWLFLLTWSHIKGRNLKS